MPYTHPITEQRFLVDHFIESARLLDRYPGLDAPTLDAIIEALADFARREIEPLATSADRQGARWTPDGVLSPPGYRAAYAKLVDAGWMSLTGPTEAGGQEMPLLLTAIFMEDMCAADMSFSLCSMLSFGAIEALTAHGSEYQRMTWLPPLVSGAWTGTMNLTEPQAGSDVGAIRTTATSQPDGRYKIKGQKIFISFGDHDMAENIIHLVLARTPEAPPGTKGISLFLVPKFHLDESGTPSIRNDVRCASIEYKLGIHGSPTCVMLFGEQDDCFGEIIGVEGGGMAAMFTMMNAARLQVGLQGVAVAEAATQHAVSYARERVQSALAGGVTRQVVPIIEHPDVRRMLLRMRALTMAARALVYTAFDMADLAQSGDEAAKTRADILTPLAKAWATDIGCEVASLGLQVHGGMGFIEETGAARLYRDARIAPIYEGTNGIQAADLVNRKLYFDNGKGISELLAEIRVDAAEQSGLIHLVDAIDEIVERFSNDHIKDRLAGSYSLLTILSIAAAGSLLIKQKNAIGDSDTPYISLKRSAICYFLDVVVAEGIGLKNAALAGSRLIYSCSTEALSIV